jgi:hypothetical protein
LCAPQERAADACAWRAAPLAGAVHAHASRRVGVATLDAAPHGGGAASFLLPPRCRFALSSAARLPAVAPALRGAGAGFRLLLLDPPWECVSVARGAQYGTLTPWQARTHAARIYAQALLRAE